MFYAVRRIIFATLSIVLMQFTTTSSANLVKKNDVKLEAEAGGISSYRLENGFKVILIPFPNASNTRIELLVKAGSKIEGYGQTGMAHLLEHMLFKGAGKRKSIKDDLTGLGATYNGTTTTDRTNFFEVVDADDRKIEELIRLEADRFIRPTFTAGDLSSEMTVVRNELENSEHQPFRLVTDALNRNLFAWHGYGRSTIGARSDIEGASYVSLKNFHKQHYRPDNAVLIISGKFDPDRVLQLTGSLFKEAKNPSANLTIDVTRESPQARTSKTDLFQNLGTTVAASGWRLPGMTERSVYAFDLAATAICDSQWGSLRKDIVVDRKLAVSTSCYTSIDPDYSKFIAYARAGQDSSAEKISSELIKHVEDAARKGITQEQLERAKLSNATSFHKTVADYQELARNISEAEVGGDWRLLFWSNDVYKSITLEEANQALSKWLIPTNRSDVLLHHSELAKPIAVSTPVHIDSLLGSMNWSNVIPTADPLPKTFTELANLEQKVDFGRSDVEAALIKRKTSGDLVYFSFENDYGSEQTLKNRRVACTAASALIKFGGNGLDRDALNARMESLHARWMMDLERIYLEVPKNNLNEAFDTLFAAWTAPLLPVAEFESYKASVSANYEAALKDPTRLLEYELAMRFDNYPEGSWNKPQKIEERLEALKSLRYEDVKRCSKDFSGVAHASLGVVGDISPNELKALWEKTVSLKASKLPYQRSAVPVAPKSIDARPIVITKPDSPNAKIIGTSVIPMSLRSEEHAALEIAVYVLGGTSRSLIWEQVREIDGFAYQAGMGISVDPYDERATVEIRATSSTGNAEKTLLSLKGVLSKALKDGISDEQLKVAKESWKESRKSFLGDETLYALSMTSNMQSGKDFRDTIELDQKIANTSSAEATRILRKYVDQSSIVWAIGKGE
jgi:zinc protease